MTCLTKNLGMLLSILTLSTCSYEYSHAMGGTTPQEEASSPPIIQQKVFGWTFLGPESTVWVRATTPEKSCPSLQVDSQTVPMKIRPATESKLFPTLVCEAQVSSSAKNIQLNGEALPIPNLNPKKIVFLGDTGCVIKKGAKKTKVQACNDPNKWPFAQITLAAANWKPDLVIHVGDYHYREADCPDSDPRCKGAISGDRWDSWEQDFFSPAAPLLKAAPWIFTRGNHELCARAGEGWFRLLEPRLAPDQCTDSTDPYRIKLSGLNISVIDASDDRTIPDSLAKVSKAFQMGEWLLLHRPFLTPGADDEATVRSTLPEEMRGEGKIGVVMSGHQHRLSLNQFVDSRPPELITGNGGTQLDKPTDTSSVLSKVDTSEYNSLVYADFGFVTMERTNDSTWIYSVRNTKGNEVVRCDFIQEMGKKAKLTCNPVN